MNVTKSYRKDESPKYLQHLDGFRGIAVLLVLLFHFDVKLLKSGYLGVDMFFTISGYIITRNIELQKERGAFDLKRFYVRRFFRLYPASTFVTFITVLCSQLFLPHSQAREVCRSALASILFSSNMFFHSFQDYFATDAKFKPLLHTWSLSLEEQFYFLWAPLLKQLPKSSTVRNSNVLLSITVVISILSFTVSCFLETRHASFVFYEIPCRSFQFAIGASTYFIQNSMQLSKSGEMGLMKRFSRETILSCLSLVSTGIAMNVFFDKYTSVRSLLISVSSSVMIVQRNSIFANWCLSSTVLIAIGKVSYSAYLIHWPLYVYSRFILLAVDKAIFHPAVLTILTLASAVVMKRQIEDPIRYGSSRIKMIFTCSVIGTALVSGIGSFDFGLNMIGNVANREDSSDDYRKFCKRGHVIKDLEPWVSQAGGCMVGDLKHGKTSKYIFIGNSFVRGIVPALHLIGQKRSERFIVHHVSRYAFCAKSMILNPTIGKLRNEACSDDSMAHWKFIASVPRSSNVTYVVCNHWYFESTVQTELHLRSLILELKKNRFSVVIMGEPPGINRELRTKMLCLDMPSVPIWKVIQYFSQEGMNLCWKSNLVLPPVPERIWQYTVFKTLFPKSNSSTGFVDLFSSMCNISNRTLCNLPISVHHKGKGSGYRSDGYHLSSIGAAYFSRTIEKYFFPNPTIKPWQPRLTIQQKRSLVEQ